MRPVTLRAGPEMTSLLVRAEINLNEIVSTLNWNTAKKEVLYSSEPIAGPLQSPFPIGLKIKGEIRGPAGADNSSMSFQAYGYGLGDPKSKGMHDLKVRIKQEKIDLNELQGYDNLWKTEEFSPVLPNPLRESQNAADTKAMAKFWNEITFYSKLSLWINKAFLPQSTTIAEAAIGFLEKHGSDYLRENLKNEKNKIIACK
ncbi:hypothetical protein PTTG_29001 [Puccinia triticina 1-1 BBBD Race 1]|uniref:Uncharacterized protein n=1 Tax=Puccinia triticina (isolate 1-1 / race 1 (BBBD)) TaxID=630390 RepID=A0A180G770_PUCT1|nr:hypothetical protein PTTG_29001 [Puccinia triticina 1-1 BBBD Race 1]